MKKIFYTLILTIFSAIVLFSCTTTEDVIQEPVIDKPIIEEIPAEVVPEVEQEIEEPVIEGEQLKEDSEVTLRFGGEEEILLEHVLLQVLQTTLHLIILNLIKKLF